MCVFRETESELDKLSCHASVCPSGEAIQMGEVDIDVGTVAKWDRIDRSQNMQNIVLRAVNNSLKNGFAYLFLKCGKNLQAVVFPPKLQQSNLRKPPQDERINVNIVVLDSVSRPHFYRVLPMSTRALRTIANDKDIPATALDFELFQSVGQNTFDNMRPMFSGVKGGESPLPNNLPSKVAH